ncbi:MAG TPA: hypothetical protein VFG47_12770 [Geminicoccaceae bacterium]|nr:hypothetical protein [Geminicoccaceae bacterium]
MSGVIAMGPVESGGGGSPGDRTAPEGPAPEAVRAELKRILASTEFSVSDRLRGFLRFVVDETLAGRAGRIKAFTVAVEVFGRGDGFDPQTDPVVRLEAARLRRALDHYYLVAGRDDPVRIDIPRGGYVPTFRSPAAPPAAPGAEREPPPRLEEPAPPPSPRRSPRPAHTAALALAITLGAAVLLGVLAGRWTVDGPASEPAAPPVGDGAAAFADRPSLVVLPFANLSGDAGRDHVARGLAEEILIGLTRFKDLVVFGRDTGFRYGSDADVREIGHLLGVRYVLRGSLRGSPDRIRVTGELLDAGTGATLWAEGYDRDLTTADIFAIQEDIARQVATAVAQPYGIIFREDAKRTALQPPERLDAYECSLRFYAYRANVGPEPHAAVRACLERAVEREPGYAAGWAMLAVLHVDEDRYLFNRRPDGPPPLDRALEAAGRAAELGPDDARVQQALMLVHFFRGEPDEAMAAGERALALNPNDTELMGEFGGRQVLLSERRERGEALLREALARNPGQAGFYHGMLAVALYLDGRYAAAADEIRRADQPDFHLAHAVEAMIYGQLGWRGEARAAARRFMELYPTFIANIDAELRKRNLGPSDQAHIRDGLRKAGVPIPESALDDAAEQEKRQGGAS